MASNLKDFSQRDALADQDPRPYGQAQAELAESGLDLRQYVRIALRWRWVIIGSVLSAFLLGIVVTFLMTPQYTAEVTIEISRDSDRVTNFQGVERDVSLADQEFYETQYGLLRSRTLAERVAAELNLVDDLGFFEMYGALDEEEAAFEVRNGRFLATGRAERRRIAGEVLLENLGVDPVRLSRLVVVRIVSPQEDFSARVANAWAENFIATNLERKVQATSYGREVLRDQLADYKERLDASQRRLVAYASREQVINLPSLSEGGQERPIVADSLATLNEALAEARADKVAAESRFRQGGGGGSSEQALANSAINNLRERRAELSAEYEKLMAVFEPPYPQAVALQRQIDELDKAIRQEERRVENSVRAEFRQAVERERRLQAEVDGLKSEFLDQRRRAIQYNVYQQEVDTNQALYDGLLQRFKEIGVAGGIGVNNIAIVDAAEIPREPSSPRLLINLLIAAVGGLMVGVGVAFALDQLDESIDDPNELGQRVGLSLLGSIPVVGDEAPEEALLDRKSELVDAYLSVQTNLGFTTQNGVPKAISVTSTRPSEGKSTTSLALATMLMRSGRRVILVDGDMRSPSVHHLARGQNERGLSNFLAGEEDVDGLISSMAEPELDYMAAGPIPPNAAELLTGRRLGDLIHRLSESYDHIVVDSPPVLGLADAPLIGSALDGVVYVVEAQGIQSGQVRAALARLAAANVRIFGGVLTKFDQRKASFGYDYGYDYGQEERVA